MSKKVQYISLDFMGLPCYRVGDDGSFWKLIGGNTKYIPFQWVRKTGGRLLDGHVDVSCKKCNSSGKLRHYLHHLVLYAFVGPRPKGMECRHLNGIPWDNRLENLCWGTRSSNMKDRVLHGNSNHGTRNGMSKLNDAAVIHIRSYKKLDTEIAETLSKLYGIKKRYVRDVYDQKSWRHVS